MTTTKHILVTFLLFALTNLADCSGLDGSINYWQVKKVREYPSDPQAFTQGLLYDNGKFYLSTGRYGRSTLRMVDTETGETIASEPLAPDQFGEGLAKVDDTLYQLTWKSGRALAYRLKDTKIERDPTSDFTYSHQGWGLTSDGKHLILSDGTSTVRFYSKNDKSLVKTVTVTYRGSPVGMINEMEYLHGKIFANILGSNKIIVFDPGSGKVTDVITVDTKILFYPKTPPLKKNKAAVLNGIAFDPETNRLFITGKLWPQIFEVSLQFFYKNSP